MGMHHLASCCCAGKIAHAAKALLSNRCRRRSMHLRAVALSTARCRHSVMPCPEQAPSAALLQAHDTHGAWHCALPAGLSHDPASCSTPLPCNAIPSSHRHYFC